MGHRIARGRLAVVAALAVAMAAAAGTALATTAGAPGRWTVVARGGGVPGDSASELGLARTPNGVLHVAWKERTGPLTEALRHRAVSPAGALGGTVTIVDGWRGLGDPELVAERDGTVRAFFGGQRSVSASDPLSGLLTSTAPASGAPWSAPSVVHQRNQSGPARNPSATVTADGTSFQAWYGVSEIYVHGGLTAAQPDQLFTADPSLSEFGPTIVDDAGRLWVGWCGFGAGGGGLFVQQADPVSGAPIGRPARLPGSTTAFGGSQVSTCNLERTVARRTPMVARAGGGVFVAGAAGYPTLSRVLVWRLAPGGDAPRGSFLVASGAFGHATPVLAAAPDGRIWVAWLELRPGAPTIVARRSNRLGTVWGAPVRVRAPSPWEPAALNVAAQRDRLDVLGLLRAVSGDRSVQHTQLRPGLTLTRAQTTRTRATVTVRFRVTDAGDPVAGARVTLAGRGSAVTAASGVAAFALPRTTRAAARVTAAKAGYAGATVTLRCC
jgi:hypothetical protein